MKQPFQAAKTALKTGRQSPSPLTEIRKWQTKGGDTWGVAFANSFVLRFILVWAVVLSLFVILRTVLEMAATA